MITDEELLDKISKSLDDYEGDLTRFYSAVGMVIVGRLVGWRAIRLMSSRKDWALATKIFGDLKEPDYIMRERERFSDRCVGLSLVDNLNDYWEYVKGHKTMPLSARRGIK